MGREQGILISLTVVATVDMCTKARMSELHVIQWLSCKDQSWIGGSAASPVKRLSQSLKERKGWIGSPPSPRLWPLTEDRFTEGWQSELSKEDLGSHPPFLKLQMLRSLLGPGQPDPCLFEQYHLTHQLLWPTTIWPPDPRAFALPAMLSFPPCPASSSPSSSQVGDISSGNPSLTP